MMSRFAPLIVCGFLVSGIGLAQAAPKTRLKMNGKIASTRVKTVGGVAMVPLADVARALGQSLTTTSDGWEIKTASGTYQAGKLTGKIGSVIQTPKYAFTVLGVQKADTYASQFLKNPQTFAPESAGDTLVMVRCRLKNTLPKAQGPLLATSYAGNTALADFAGTSHAPIGYDSRIVSDFSASSMLPGSQNEFVVVFSVPKDAQLKDIVFSVTDYFDPNFKGVDVRVSLK
ncbi:hypothetical protein IAD21_04068 [Abditibacteriota bacterium]|nr:hypothetical protein IAD21_04068 [Abditibacteriota bacterium]